MSNNELDIWKERFTAQKPVDSLFLSSVKKIILLNIHTTIGIRKLKVQNLSQLRYHHLLLVKSIYMCQQ